MTSKLGTYDTQSGKKISVDGVSDLLQKLGCTHIYVKKLAPNDNSKNQPYFGSHLTDLPFIPTGELVTSASVSKKNSNTKRKIKYQTTLDLSWVDADGVVYDAPHSKLIYYPQYPEVRFSGFLRGSKVNASEWMSPDKQGRSEGRWLILGITKNESIYAYLATPESRLSRELAETNFIEVSNVFCQLDVECIAPKVSTREALISKLLEIHHMGWVSSRRLNSEMSVIPYKALNGGGYTLECMLGISPNGIAEPDYLGWEVKQFGVSKFPTIASKPTTLMTPEPNGGFYCESGAIEFVRNYGYPDKRGNVDRLNFGGKHNVGECQKLTGLTMELIGFDSETSSITDAEGTIALIDSTGNVTASWSFAKLMDHWKHKHSQAVYIPCMKRTQSGINEYYYGKDIEMGTGTNFEMILSAMHLGSVYYDPGIKLEHASTDKPKIKRRNQFRVNHKHLNTLYTKFEFVDVKIEINS
ncbi:MAG: MvaI/BcnI family restriction endonuclease [Candidatus Endonucleobacter sp. (ex Gigantidas childressi)]|nr:MvaI/BcnI family restriction endonuclease [Candidatus Endonucleobacter sp. (ex Gigantidas childressi)]